MVFAQAARKTAGLMLLSMLISLALVTLLSTDLDDAVTGRITSAGISPADGNTWIIFSLGMFVGALMISGYIYVLHLEAKREE